MGKKITIIGSTAYQDRMHTHKLQMEAEGHEVNLPAFDSFVGFTVLQICRYNLDKIKWADEIHIIWDARSSGTILDLGMCLALDKAIKVIYLNQKTFTSLLEQMAERKE